MSVWFLSKKIAESTFQDDREFQERKGIAPVPVGFLALIVLGGVLRLCAQVISAWDLGRLAAISQCRGDATHWPL